MYQKLLSEDGMHEDDVQAQDNLQNVKAEDEAGEEQVRPFLLMFSSSQSAGHFEQ